jgi:hypothetical protein
MLSLFAAAVMVSAAAPAAAQDNAVGVKVGVNFATFDFDEEASGLERLGNKTGLMAGVFMTRHLQDNLGLQIEGLISQKGAKFEDNFFNDEEYNITVTYLEIPVLLRYNVPFGTGDSTFHVYGGPAFGIKLADRQELEGDELDEDDEQELKGTDVGLAVGGGVSFDRWVIDLRYTHGLTNINDDFNSDDFDVKNRAFTISVGWIFR